MLPLVMENFLLYLEGEKRDIKTIQAYRTNLECFVKNVLNDDKNVDNSIYDSLTVEDLMDWLEKIKEDRVNRGLSEPSASTLNQRISTIKKFYNYLCGIRLAKTNIAQGISQIKNNEIHQTVVLEEREVVSLVNKAKEKTYEFDKGFKRYVAFRDEMIINLFLCTGLRISELSSINMNDINLVTRELKVVGKRNKKRVVAIPKSKMLMLENYIRLRNELKSSSLDDALFLSRQKGENGYRLGNNQIRNIVVELAKESDVKKITPHSLRHTGATLQIKNGADLIDVSKWLGHSSLAITEQIYVHQTNTSAHKVAELFDGMF